eukprot:999750_1
MALQCFDIVDQKQFHVCKLELDIGSNIQKVHGTANKNQAVIKEFELLDLCGNIRFYPKGNNDAKDGNTSIFMWLDANFADKRNIDATICHFKDKEDKRGYTWRLESRDVCTYRTSSWGWPNFIKLDDIQSHSKLVITIQIEVNPESKKESEIKSNSMKAIHEYSMKHGDITIVVNGVTDEPIHEPPTKKRKIHEKQGLDSDDTSRSQTRTIQAISGVLKAESPVFAAMLENDMKEKDTRTIHISANSFKDVQDMLYFVTTRKLRESADLISLMDLAQLYQMERLQNVCREGMLKSLDDDLSDIVRIVLCFDKYRITKGYDFLIELARDNVDDIIDFDQLSHSFQYFICNKKKT